MALAPGPRLRVDDLPGNRHSAGLASAAGLRDLPLTLDAYERCALERALVACSGDASVAARRLGIGRSTFYRKLARHGIASNRR